MAVQLNEAKCLGCGCCMDACDYGAMEFAPVTDTGWAKSAVNDDECTECEQCTGLCPTQALSLV